MHVDGLELFNGGELEGLVIPTVNVLPVNPEKGRLVIFENKIRIFNGIEWNILN